MVISKIKNDVKISEFQAIRETASFINYGVDVIEATIRESLFIINF